MTIAILALWAVFIFKSRDAANSFKEAYVFCANTIIPSLFPFLILSNIITTSGMSYLLENVTFGIFSKIFKISTPCASAFVLGSVSGFPVGAQTAANLYRCGYCAKEDAEYIIAFSNNAGPAFLIAGVGIGMLNNPQAGIILYLSQLSAAIACGIILGRGRKSCYINSKNEVNVEFISSIGPSIAQASLTMVKICGFVLAFAFITDYILSLDVGITGAVMSGFLEFSAGISAIAKQPVSPLNLALISLICGFSGISVFLQVYNICHAEGLSIKKFFIGKILTAGLSAIITYVFSLFLIKV